MINILQVLRLFGSIAIFTHHLNYPWGLGTIGVTFFFVLSGFIMAYKYHDKFQVLTRDSVVAFVWKRIKSIYPLYIITFILSIGIMIKTGFVTNIKSTIINLLMMQAYFPIREQVFAYNSVTWFISDMMLFYLVTPFILHFIGKINSKKKIKVAIYLEIVIIVMSFIIAYNYKKPIEAYSVGWWYIYISPCYRILDYVAGILAGIIFVNIKKIGSKQILNKWDFTLYEILVLAFCYYSFKSTYLADGATKMGSYFILSSVLLIMIFAFEKGFISNILVTKRLVSLGGISMYIYMIHQLVINYISFFIPEIYGNNQDIFGIIWQLLAFILVVLLSYIMKVIVEKLVKVSRRV